MKTKTTSNPGPLSRSLFTSLLASAAVCLSVVTTWTAHAQSPTSNLFASINSVTIDGVNTGGTLVNGGGSILQFTPAGTPSMFGPALDTPRGIAFDNTGNFFVATNTSDESGNSQGTILKITPGGIMSTFASGFPTNFFLQGLVFDSAGNLFVMAPSSANGNTPSTIYKITPEGGVSPFGLDPSCSCSIPLWGRGLAFDSAGNLFAADNGSQTIFKFTQEGVRSVFADPTAFTEYPFEGPSGLAFDGSGNLFVSTEGVGGSDVILTFSPGGIVTTFATGLSETPRGIAFDSAGNLFVAEVGVSAPPPITTYQTGDIREFTPGGSEVLPTFAAEIGPGHYYGNRGAEWLAFPPPNTTIASNVTEVVALMSEATAPGTTTVTPIADPSAIGPLPTGIDPNDALAFEITTTATYTPPIIIAVQLPLFEGDEDAFNQLQILHWNGTSWDNVTASDPARVFLTKTIYASTPTLSPFVVAKETLKAQIQQPINADGTSVFNVHRGVVPVKFTLTNDGTATCALPGATIALTRTSGGTTGAVDESVYSGSADTGSNFRTSSCQYIYNLSASALGVGTYRADIKINGTVVGNAAFQLK